MTIALSTAPHTVTTQLNCAGISLDLSKPCIMGILNVTPNSQTRMGQYMQSDAAIAHAVQMVKEGADIIDVGGEATNPGTFPQVSLDEELARVVPVVERLRQEIDVPISVDTSKPEVIRAVVKSGAGFINDVRALRLPGALEAVQEMQVPVCLMHMVYPHGIPENHIKHTDTNIVAHTLEFLQQRMDACIAAGIGRQQIVIDPGIGHGSFGKNLQENLTLMKHIDAFHALGAPVLIGASRKTFIGEQLNLPVEERLYPSVAAAVIAAMQGAQIIRVHDVKATVEAVRLTTAIMKCSPD